MISEKTGWSKKQILHDHSFAELNFMLADAPKVVRKKETKTFANDDELAAWFGQTLEE